MNARVPTPIRGKIYSSQSEAARALGVPQSAVFSAAEKGTLDGVGLGRNHSTKHPVSLDGVKYDSQADLARAIGVDPKHLNTKVRKARKQGRKSITIKQGVVSWT